MAKKAKDGANYQQTKVEVVESTKTHQHDIFIVVEHNGEFMIALGNSIVSKCRFNSKEEAEQYIDSKPWELIFNGTAVMMATINQQSNK